MSAVLFEELLRYTYVLSLLTLTKLVTWAAVPVLLVGSTWVAWRLSRPRRPGCTPGVCLQPQKRCSGSTTRMGSRLAHG